VIYREYSAQHGAGIFWDMLCFVGVLTVGYVYAIMKGVLDWKR
jgi:NADH-quinone oxidoreductase subunit A